MCDVGHFGKIKEETKEKVLDFSILTRTEIELRLEKTRERLGLKNINNL